MPPTQRSGIRALLPRRALSRYLLVGLFLLLLLLVLNASLFYIYSQVRGSIAAELGRRLLAVATTAAAGIPGERLGALRRDPQGETAATLRAFLQRVRFETDVGGIYLLDADRRHLLDPDQRHPLGYENPSLELHYATITAALAGVPEASGLYRVGDVFLRTAFAPILDREGRVRGVLAVEGGTDFFTGLLDLRRHLLWSAAGGMLVMAALALFFLRLLRAQAGAQRALRETSALAAAGELAAILAHEIRNPLAIISSRAERVQRKIERGKPTEEILDWFAAIPREVERLNRTLTQYLGFARPSERHGESAPLGGTLDAALGFLENDLARKGITLRRQDAGVRETHVAMAAAALHQVLLNLLLNARDAMPDGGHLAVAARRSGGGIELRVRDDGCGMSPTAQRRAFELFYTTKPHGSGLGLAVVRSMCDLYGARARIQSREGEGTEVVLWLPRADGPSARGAATNGGAPPVSEEQR
ncbi:MAG: hypothetical protein GF330_09210 [Candidatus Eisenbacteria bacterium]|nr:hypothetical protein [Candidatus Eisenbacteria bacterium]